MAQDKTREDKIVEDDQKEANEIVETFNEDTVEEVAAPAADDDQLLAKSGKRSAKSIRESEAKIEKEARKEAGDTSAQGDETAAETKGPKPVTRTRLERRSKSFRKVAGQIEAGKQYSLKEALELAAKTNPVKFDASVELHIRLGVDPRQADQNIRSTVTLPNGTGKTIRVAVLAPSDQHKAAKDAGADIVGEDEFLQQLDKGEINFDILVATPQMMPKLGKYARTLGPKGLMPNPKSGTVATNVAKAVTEAKAGRVEYRVDKQAIIHLAIGKVSFGAAKLDENARAFFTSLQSVKPTTIKGSYILSVSAATTMGPGVAIDSSDVQ